MLKVNMEFRKGVLFLRLFGKLNQDTYKTLQEEIDGLIKKIGLKYMVINLEKIDTIDCFGLELLTTIYNNITNSEGVFIICGNNEKINKQELSKIGYRNISELGALRMVNI